MNIKTKFNYIYVEQKSDGVNRAVRITNPIHKILNGIKEDIRTESTLYTDSGNSYGNERVDWNGLGTKVTDTNFIGSIKVEFLENRG